MADVHDPQTRSRNMAATRGRDTKPEKLLRQALHRAGYRYRLGSALPGRPDLTLPKYRATIFVHGCFWHRHSCPRFKQPGGENAAFWRDKLNRNAARDAEVTQQLRAIGRRQLVVWECALTGKARLDPADLTAAVGVWLRSDAATGSLCGLPQQQGAG